MPKLKTKSAAAKRYRLTGNGKVKVGRKGKRHNASAKNKKRKRHLRGTLILGPTNAPMARAMLPYGQAK
jgi:large subunit ribosomal protein L35